MEFDFYPEAVALFTGSRHTRRAVLEQAAKIVGPSGMVHVVRDAAARVTSVAGMLGYYGLDGNLDWVEGMDFEEAAKILAPVGCSWTWTNTYHAAWPYAVKHARRNALPVVLPAWSWRRPWGGARMVLPAYK
ncbi:hypothetical protein ACIHDR_23885 [Nocardia sp. NPDC052278]|uniref:hypothetical protein n=1 Tax=unclassified Nocardia TaxID=2637762 RepID=UPI00368513B7